MRVDVEVGYCERGFTAVLPGVRHPPIVALSLSGLRQQIERAMPGADLVLHLDRAATAEQRERRVGRQLEDGERKRLYRVR
jgi:hypothetical protein